MAESPFPLWAREMSPGGPRPTIGGLLSLMLVVLLAIMVWRAAAATETVSTAPNGRPDPARGIREFVVGTGGANLRTFRAVEPNSEVRHNSNFGVLLLELRPDGCGWRFASTAGGSFSDSGSGTCH